MVNGKPNNQNKWQHDHVLVGMQMLFQDQQPVQAEQICHLGGQQVANSKTAKHLQTPSCLSNGDKDTGKAERRCAQMTASSIVTQYTELSSYSAANSTVYDDLHDVLL